MRKHLFVINLFILGSIVLFTFLCSLNLFAAFAAVPKAIIPETHYMPTILIFPVAVFMFSSSFILTLVFALKFQLVGKIINISTASLSFPFGVVAFIYAIDNLNAINTVASQLGNFRFVEIYPVAISSYVMLFILGIAHLGFSILLLALKNKVVSNDNGEVSEVETVTSSKKEEVVSKTKPVSTSDVLASLKELKELLDNNAITADEYAVLKQKELNKL